MLVVEKIKRMSRRARWMLRVGEVGRVMDGGVTTVLKKIFGLKVGAGGQRYLAR